MGYFDIGIYHPKTKTNLGTLRRSALQLGASGIFTIEMRYQEQASDTPGAIRHLPLRHYANWEQFKDSLPYRAVLVGVGTGGQPLARFYHPPQAVYLLGAEDEGLPPEILSRCHRVVSIESVRLPSFNVAVAGSIVMYHRLISLHEWRQADSRVPVPFPRHKEALGV